MITDLSDFRLKKAIDAGIDVACNVGKEDLAEKVKEKIIIWKIFQKKQSNCKPNFDGQSPSLHE